MDRSRRSVLRSGVTTGLGLSIGSISGIDPVRAWGTTTDVLGTNQPRSVDSAEFEPLGRVPLDGAADAVVGDNGEVVYVAVDDGFATVDVSEPTNPTVLAEVRELTGNDNRTLAGIRDVQVSGNRLAVPGPATMEFEEYFHGFILYDVSDPSEPIATTEPFETGYFIHNCFLDDEILYVVANGIDGNPLVIFDVANDEIEEIGRWSMLNVHPEWEDVHWQLRFNHDVYIHDDVAYVPNWNAGTYLLDVTDPADPVAIGHVIDPAIDVEQQRAYEVADLEEPYQGLPGNDHYATVDETGTLLGINRESWAVESGESSGAGPLELYDASDPSSIEKQSRIDPPETDDASFRGGMWTTSHNYEIRGNRLYSAWYQGGVKVHDVSDPRSPIELAHWRDDEIAGFWTARVADLETCFIASSTTHIPNTSTEGALYTFPTLAEPDTESPSPADGNRSTGIIPPSPIETDDPIPGMRLTVGLASLLSLAGCALGFEYLREKRRDRENR